MGFNFLTALSEQEFKAYLKEALREILLELNGSSPTTKLQQADDDFLTIKEASAYTRIPKATLYGYTHKKMIPFSKMGKKLLFLKEELKSWVKEHRKKTKDQVDQEVNNYMLKAGKTNKNGRAAA